MQSKNIIIIIWGNFNKNILLIVYFFFLVLYVSHNIICNFAMVICLHMENRLCTYCCSRSWVNCFAAVEVETQEGWSNCLLMYACCCVNTWKLLQFGYIQCCSCTGLLWIQLMCFMATSWLLIACCWMYYICNYAQNG